MSHQRSEQLQRPVTHIHTFNKVGTSEDENSGDIPENGIHIFNNEVPDQTHIFLLPQLLFFNTFLMPTTGKRD